MTGLRGHDPDGFYGFLDNDLDVALPPDLDLTPVPDEQARRAVEVIRRSGLVAFWDARLTPLPEVLPDGTTRSKGGQPRDSITVHGLLVAMLLVAVDCKAMHLLNFNRMLHHRLSPTIRAELGIARPPYLVVDRADATPTDKKAALTSERNALKQVTRLWHAMVEPVDPSPLPKNRIRTKAEIVEAARRLTAEQVAERQLLLDHVTGRILEATWLMLPKGVRRAWKGSLGHDATFVGTWARGRTKTSPEAPCDPDAGYYVRTGDHKAPDDIGGKYHKDGTPKSKFGYDAEIAVIGADNPDDLSRFPLLALGVRLHRPGHSPGPNCIEVLRDIGRRHLLADPVTGHAYPPGTHPDGPTPGKHPTGWLGADRAYNNSKPENWLLPALALGYDPVFDYREEDLGKQDEHQGMVLVDGTWYSPSIKRKPALITATKDLLAGRIDRTKHQALVKAREIHALRVIDRKRDADGNYTGIIKRACGAAGQHGRPLRPVAACDRKAESLKPTPTFLSLPVMLTPKPVAGEGPPPICTQQTVTSDVGAYSKHQQTLAHRGPEWSKVYSSLRNTIEGTNALAKDLSKQAIEPGERRRVRGIAATSILVAFLLAARNLRKITSFYKTADWNPDGTMTVNRPKAPRTRRRPNLDDWHPDHARSLYAPPTAKPPPPDPTTSVVTTTAEKADTTARARQRAMRARQARKG